MCTSSIDVYYVFTGRRSINDFKYIYLDASFEELLVCLKCINTIAKEKRLSCKGWELIYYHTEYIEFAEWSIAKEKNIFKATRLYLGKKQSEMSKILGVDVKKFRSLENNDLPPNSEMIFEMYKSFKVSPVLFLRDKRCLEKEINCLIESVEEEVRQQILSIIEFTLGNF